MTKKKRIIKWFMLQKHKIKKINLNRGKCLGKNSLIYASTCKKHIWRAKTKERNEI